jgi:hypothetical protein
MKSNSFSSLSILFTFICSYTLAEKLGKNGSKIEHSKKRALTAIFVTWLHLSLSDFAKSQGFVLWK